MTFEEWRRELSNWQPPQHFRDNVRKMWAEHGDELLTNPHATRLFRDAQPASDFALLRAQKVRLAADPPDFELDTLEGRQGYEVVEADSANRKRSDEIKIRRKRIAEDIASGKLEEGAPYLESVPEDAYATTEAAWGCLERAASNKASRSRSNPRYKPDWGLLIYLNLFKPRTSLLKQIETEMVQATAYAKDRFAEVWVIWEGTAYKTWQSGMRCRSILRPPDVLDDTDDWAPEPLSSILRR